MHGPTCIFWASLTPFSLQRAAAASLCSVAGGLGLSAAPAALPTGGDAHIFKFFKFFISLHFFVSYLVILVCCGVDASEPHPDSS
jgi:hypothetical protein